MTPAARRRRSAAGRLRGWSVHLLTASGVLAAFQAVAEICAPDTDPRRVFAWLGLAVIIDAVDGPLARRWQVKQTVPHIDGRTIDDIVDYLTFTFIPLLLIWRMGWVPEPAAAWIAPALVTSLLGFANVGAKEEAGGFFLGFPSYWNVVRDLRGDRVRALGAVAARAGGARPGRAHRDAGALRLPEPGPAAVARARHRGRPGVDGAARPAAARLSASRRRAGRWRRSSIRCSTSCSPCTSTAGRGRPAAQPSSPLIVAMAGPGELEEKAGLEQDTRAASQWRSARARPSNAQQHQQRRVDAAEVVHVDPVVGPLGERPQQGEQAGRPRQRRSRAPPQPSCGEHEGGHDRDQGHAVHHLHRRRATDRHAACSPSRRPCPRGRTRDGPARPRCRSGARRSWGSRGRRPRMHDANQAPAGSAEPPRPRRAGCGAATARRSPPPRPGSGPSPAPAGPGPGSPLPPGRRPGRR